ncbi:hypothetical protein DSO57_1003360 [Entomophthora muscae]|nr:hypothetical protein DSO57_1003360 [Entomophthora muscae]
MQQHSGQHLLSAVFEKLYDLETTSWLLGDLKCYIELPISSKKLSKDMVQNAEKECNRLIREALSFAVESFDLSDPTVARPSSIPDNYTDGILRYVCIDGYDRNPCCGTHVEKTSHLQAVKLLNIENNGNNSLRLFFNFGDRIVAQLQASFDRDLEINTLLSTRPEEFLSKITLLKQQSRDATKQLKKLSGELAQLSVQQAISDLEKETVVAIFKTGVDPDFIKIAQIALKPWIAKHSKEDAEPRALILSACAGSESSGPVVVFGHPQLVPKVVEHISGTGSLKGAMAGDSKWQGKSSALPALYKKLASISLAFNDTTLS